MSHFDYNKNTSTVTVKSTDLDTSEKVRKFVKLFGRSNYYKAFHTLSEKVHGDGGLQEVQNAAATIDQNDPNFEQKWERAQALMEKEQERLSDFESASVDVPIYDGTAENVLSNFDMAADYLGEVRASRAAGFDNGQEQVTKQTLRRNNKHVKEQRKKEQNIQRQLEELKAKREQLLKAQREPLNEDED